LALVPQAPQGLWALWGLELLALEPQLIEE
jgi:hypothetical protein